MNETLDTFPDPEIPTIIPDTGAKRPNMDVDMTYIKNKNIDEAIRQKLSNKYVYETDTQNICNLIVG